MAAAYADDRPIHIPEFHAFILTGDENNARVNLTLLLDSKGLFTNIGTLQKQKKFWLRPTATRLRDSLESNEISNLHWISGPLHLSDALTNVNSLVF